VPQQYVASKSGSHPPDRQGASHEETCSLRTYLGIDVDFGVFLRRCDSGFDSFTSGIPGALVQDIGARGHDGGSKRLTGDVDCSAAHIDDGFHSQQQTHAGERQTQGRQGQGQHDRCAGGASSCGGANDGDKDNEQVVRQCQVNIVELRDENSGDRRVDRGAAIHLGGSTQWDSKGCILTRNTHGAFRNALGNGHDAHRRTGDEAKREYWPDALVKIDGVNSVELQYRWIDDAEYERKADIDGENKFA